MISVTMLAELGLPPAEISEFLRLEEKKQYVAQVRLLRKYRGELLDRVHANEKLINGVDYLLYEIERQKRR